MPAHKTENLHLKLITFVYAIKHFIYKQKTIVEYFIYSSSSIYVLKYLKLSSMN